VRRILIELPRCPVITVASAERFTAAGNASARAAIDELVGAGVLRRRQIGRGTTAYLAREVSDLITLSQLRLDDLADGGGLEASGSR
jgi:hypothetical protein